MSATSTLKYSHSYPKRSNRNTSLFLFQRKQRFCLRISVLSTMEGKKFIRAISFYATKIFFKKERDHYSCVLYSKKTEKMDSPELSFFSKRTTPFSLLFERVETLQKSIFKLFFISGAYVGESLFFFLVSLKNSAYID